MAGTTEQQRFAAPKGTYDVLPPDSGRWLAVRELLLWPARRAGYGYTEAPIFEDTALFQRGMGEATEVVSKEMYTFTDKGDRSITLRPEGTAGVVRLAIEHGLQNGQLPAKLWYAGPMFRYERPQAGRYRQFQQVGVEALGVDDPALDAEVVALGSRAFGALGLSKVELLLTSLGDPQCRPAYVARLQEFLQGLPLPDEDTRRRVALNPLRVLDDKRPEVLEMLVGAPVLTDHLCDDCRAHYDAVREYLHELGIAWKEAPTLVRGLDYYRRTAFEWQHSGLGAQSAVGGGGRYDGLSEAIGGPPLPGVGWALGMERILLALDAESTDERPVGPPVPPRCDVYVVALGAAAKKKAVVIVDALRAERLNVDMSYGDRGLKGSMKGADRSGAHTALVLGDRDLAEGVVQVKDLKSGEQRSVPLESLVEELVHR
ncbi:MAG: histidyl-tRNA synthetase [Frankiaceae bacterium]|nr:histidyl-tRNA synthetase [Frankiaceae bacterium]